MDWAAVWLTLRLATCTTMILFVVGIPLAHWLATSQRRWKFLVEAVVALPLVLPPTVLGFYLLLAMGPNSFLGRFYTAVVGTGLPFSFTGLLLASVLYSLPFAVRPFATAFAAVDHQLVEASWCLGVSKLGTFRRVVMPLSWTGILSGVILCFAHTVGEFGVVLMVGGNIPGETRTVSISIYDEVQSLNYAAANQSALLLLLFAGVTLCITYALQRRPGIL